jgi:hypothetical protein
VEKALLIPNTNVVQPTFEGEDVDYVWMVWNQWHPNAIHKVQAPSLNMCMLHMWAWALHDNLCKHQIVVFRKCINFTKENIISFRTNWGSFKVMFVDKMYLQLDHGFQEYEDYNKD